MNKKNSIFVIVLAFIILGALISLQVRTILEESKKSVSVEDRYKQFKSELSSEEKDILDYQGMIAQKEKIIKAYEKSAGKKDTNVEQMRLDLEAYNVLAGLSDVTGPGIVITLDDADVRKDDLIDDSETIIHDLDIVEFINELRSAGAQALSVNDERIISTSEQICAGPTIKINDNKYATPFVLKAIGDSTQFKAQLEDPHSVINGLLLRGIKIDIKYSNDIKINKFKGSIYPLIGKKGS